MIIALALSAAAAAQSSVVVPAGVSSQLHRAVIRVEERLAVRDFAGAAKLAELLPKRNVRVLWDDSKAPPARRESFAAARDAAFEGFRLALKDLKFEVVTARPDIKISFADSLPTPPGEALPEGAAFIFSDSTSDARVEAVIGLRRGNPLQPATPADVQNEVAYAIGSYFGMTQTRISVGSMARVDFSRSAPNRPSLNDARGALAAIRIGDQLREAIQKKRVLQPSRPQALITPQELTYGSVIQGSLVPFSVQVTNTGTGELQVRVLPDCSCVGATGMISLKAGDTGLIKVAVDTSEVPGDLRRRLILYTNDVDFPTRDIPISFKVEPRFTFLTPFGGTILMEEGGAAADVFLLFPTGKPLNVTEARLDGLNGSVTFEPWSGRLANPEAGEPEMERKGYRFRVSLADSLPPGVAEATILVGTDDQQFPLLRFNVRAQKGIVAMPDQIYLGEVSGAKRASALISRPRSAFKVLKVESESPYLKATFAQSKYDWEYKLSVSYLGGAPQGDFVAPIKVYTDDPKQPVITVTVRAVIR